MVWGVEVTSRSLFFEQLTVQCLSGTIPYVYWQSCNTLVICEESDAKISRSFHAIQRALCARLCTVFRLSFRDPPEWQVEKECLMSATCLTKTLCPSWKLKWLESGRGREALTDQPQKAVSMVHWRINLPLLCATQTPNWESCRLVEPVLGIRRCRDHRHRTRSWHSNVPPQHWVLKWQSVRIPSWRISAWHIIDAHHII